MSETKHHPTPYKVRKMPYMSSEGYYRLDILDAGDCVVAGIGVAKEDWPNAKTAEFLVEAANAHERLCVLVNRLLPLAMAAGAQSPKLKPIADACFKEGTAILKCIVEVKDEQ